MSAVSYTDPNFVRTRRTTPAAPQGFLARLWEAAKAAHAQQIEREYLRYFEIHGHDPVVV